MYIRDARKTMRCITGVCITGEYLDLQPSWTLLIAEAANGDQFTSMNRFPSSDVTGEFTVTSSSAADQIP